MKVNLLLFSNDKRYVVLNEGFCEVEIPNTEQLENESIKASSLRILNDIIGIDLKDDIINFPSSIQGVTKTKDGDIVFNEYNVYGVLPKELEDTELSRGMIWYQVPETVMFDLDSLGHAEMMLTILSVYKSIS